MRQDWPQLDRTRELIADAETGGRERLIEMNRPIELNLVRVIEGLQSLGGTDWDADDNA